MEQNHEVKAAAVSTQELKELVSLGLSAGELVAGLGNGLGFDDVTKALEVVRKISAASKAKVALDEYRSMTDAQAADLEAFVKADFDIADDKVELAVEAALAVVINLHALADLVLPKAA